MMVIELKGMSKKTTVKNKKKYKRKVTKAVKQRMHQQSGRLLNGFSGTYGPIIDFFGISLEKQVDTAVAYNCRYLHIIDPEIIVCTAKLVFGAFNKELLYNFFLTKEDGETESVLEFYHEGGVIETVEELQSLSSGPTYRTNSLKSGFPYLHNIGDVFIVFYGPYDMGISLFFILPNSSNIRYDPKAQALKYHLLFLSYQRKEANGILHLVMKTL